MYNVHGTILLCFQTQYLRPVLGCVTPCAAVLPAGRVAAVAAVGEPELPFVEAMLLKSAKANCSALFQKRGDSQMGSLGTDEQICLKKKKKKA